MFSNLIEQLQKYPSPHPMIDVYLVTYRSQGLKVKGFLAVPQVEHKLPAIVYLRGGIKNVGMVRLARVIEFAAQGFVVFAPFYRGNKGGEGREDFAGEDVWDAVHAYEILQECPVVSPYHIHLFGFSRGGVMALLTATKVKNPCSVVTWGGVSDMKLTYEERIDLRKMMKRVIGGTPAKVPLEYERRTALLKVKQLNCPILIVHGKHDLQVSVEHALRLEKALQNEKKQFDSWIFEEYGHHIPLEKKREITKNVTKWMKMQ
ncbi:alpha/beta hydrolase [Lottiidibacillus patelloidae]|uniref:Alpha/beta hydrolase n=1 Tax=Lottiidibacillus patelloidae TaxID=2670334 RepID=A0A263BS51_9BACI|nr:prolyl oligopeptidase family serine peptidase [Lottiidibacillus patelloidae]OZM56197.1 alpha/beta hydrolase [Lottiidibacillus patelloidae]